MSVSKEQWDAWLQDPVTQAFRAWARLEAQKLKDTWASAGFVSPDHFQSAIQNSAAMSACELYQEIADMEFEIILGDQTDEQ